MKKIRTVLGDISPEELGFTDAHEHLIIDKDYVLKLNPDYRLDSVEKTAKEVRSFMAAGGNAAVEMTCLNFGRSAKKMVEVAKQTGFHIIASTGFHRPQFYMDSHWRFFYTVDQSEQGRLDLIAFKVYGNTRLWWVIASANLIEDTINLPIAGDILKIPSLDSLNNKNYL